MTDTVSGYGNLAIIVLVIFTILGCSKEVAYEPLLESSLAVTPLSESDYLDLAENADYPEQAITHLNQGINQFPNQPALYLARSQFYKTLEQYALALSDQNRVIQLSETDFDYYVERAELLRRLGRFSQAIEDLNFVLNADPSLPSALYQRAIVRFSKQDFEGSLMDLEHYMSVRPEDLEPLYYRAAIYEALGRTKDAVSDLEKYVSLVDAEGSRSAGQALLDKLQSQISEQL